MKTMAAMVLLTTVAMLRPALAHADDLATGNLHFNAADMDSNGDQMIDKDEFMHYDDTLWTTMSRGAGTVSVNDAAKAFAQGNMNFDARRMDTDHDGMISKAEFMAYGANKFDHMKGADGMMSVADASKNFARGNR